MKKRFTLLLLSIMLAMPFIAYASQPSEAQSRAGGDNNGTFAYVITSPEPGDEKFYNISIQFTNAHTIAFIPSLTDRTMWNSNETARYSRPNMLIPGSMETH